MAVALIPRVPVPIILVTNWFPAGPLQVLGSTLAGRVIGTRFGQSVSRCPGIFQRPQGAFPPGFYSLRGGLVYRPAPEECRRLGNADGAVGIFGNSGRVWATALRPVPPKKRSCAILARKVGRSTNTPVKIILVTNWFRTEPLQVLGSALAGRVIGTRFGQSVSRCLGISYSLRGPSPQAITPLREVGLIARCLRHFWETSGACGQRPCTRTHRKKALCHTCL